MSRRDELIIQRFVDGELEEHECSDLLSRLDSREEWRMLALSFVETQLLRKALADEPSSPPPVAARPGWRERLRRMAHPLASVAAALCVGVLTGAGVHYSLPGRSPAAPEQVAARRTASRDTSVTGRTPAEASAWLASQAGSRGIARPSAPSPLMNVNLVGLKGKDTQPVSVPVYSHEQWQSLPQMRQSSLLPEQVRRELESQGYVIERQPQWYRARMQDGREILIPTENVKLRYGVQ